MNVRNVSFSSTLFVHGTLAAAIKAACHPFGSLIEGVDTQALAESLVEASSAHGTEARMAGFLQVLQHLQTATTNQWATAEFGWHHVTLRTPASGTQIRVQQDLVTVDFGADGSESRAWSIIAAGVRAGVVFSAETAEGEHLTRKEVIEGVAQRAQSHIDWLEELPPTYYGPEQTTAMVARTEGDLEQTNAML